MAHADEGLWYYRARLVRVVDGDTVIMLVDLGMHVHSTQSIRVQGVNTPELFSGTDRSRGRAAMAFTSAWVDEHAAHDPDAHWPFRLRTIVDRQTFGRYVGAVTCCADHDLATAIRDAGWDDGGKY